MITFTPATGNEWGGALTLAREYLHAEARGTHKYILARMRDDMDQRTLRLIDLGRLLGSPVVEMSISPGVVHHEDAKARSGEGKV